MRSEWGFILLLFHIGDMNNTVKVNPSGTCSVKMNLSHFELALVFQLSSLRWISLFCVPDTLKSCECLAVNCVMLKCHCSAQVIIDF